MLKYRPLFEGREGPVMIEPAAGRPSLLDTVIPVLSEFRQRLTEHGALLLRGFRVTNAQDFDDFVTGFSDRHLKYIHRSSPREVVTGNVLTATSYPRQLDIPLHSENAYQSRWPLTIAFCCTVAARQGGETPIAAMHAVSDQIGAELMEKLDVLGVEYVRHYHDSVDLSWQNVFQTDSREVVQRYCCDNHIKCTWLDNGLLRTAHVAQGVASHPLLRTRIYFNQAHLFHVSALGQVRARAMKSVFGEDRLPRNAYFGDGSEISDDELSRIRGAFAAHELAFRWQPGDVLLLDNMQYGHGRRSFGGDRSVFTALMDPYP